MLQKWFNFVIAGVAVLVAVILVSSNTRIPGSGGTASVIDAITQTDITTVEPAPVEPAPVLIEPVPAESVPAIVSTDTAPTDTAPVELIEPEGSSEPERPTPVTPTGISIFKEILQGLLPPLSIENPVPTAPKGASRLNLKVFVQDQETLESAVNNWFTVQQNIVVDQLNVQDYGGGGYLVVVSYHTGGTGNSSTRLKLIAGENPEADAQAFLSSLDTAQTVRFVAATTRSYPGSETTVFAPIIFIVYE